MTTSSYIILLLLLLLLHVITTTSQSTSPPPPPSALATFTPSVATIIVILVAALFFVAFFSLYLRLCSDPSTSPSPSLRRRTAPASVPSGLDAAVVESFPILLYSEVKDHKIGKSALECAVCLNEFDDVDELRLLPRCDHVFHPECIDAWLASHVTCPVCRANLVPQETDIKAENNPDMDCTVPVMVVPVRESSDPDPDYTDQDRDQTLDRRTLFVTKFPRSHSTGHSIVRPGDCTERFTLRLPENVRKQVMIRALTRAATFSMATTEGSSRKGRRNLEGSNRGARSYKKLDRAVKSDRWVITVPFFAQAGLTENLGDGEGSTRRGMRNAVRLPSFKCLERNTSGDSEGHETGLMSTGPVRSPV